MFLNDGNLLDDEIKLFVSVLCSLQLFSFIPWECAMQNVAFTMLLKIMGSSYKQLSIHFREFWELFVVNSNFILYLSNKYYVCMWKVPYCWSKEVQNLEKKYFFTFRQFLFESPPIILAEVGWCKCQSSVQHQFTKN